jgi:actin-like ATPase involved in cell morphogenesis
MSYQLGIDLGTTYTAAAISRATERSAGGVDVVTLGARSATVASVMYLADDGSVLVGEAAERRALTDPDRVVREFKRRIGDEIPLLLGGRQYQAHELAARMTRWVVDLVSEREGGPPRRIAVTHPASWGSHKKDLFAGALRNVGLTVTFLAEPQAAAVSYASAERIDPGSTVAVYDLGGGTFDAAVVSKTGNGSFELLGQPEGIERLGGIDFDEVVFGFVREAIGDKLDSLDPEDPDVLSAVARLRREVVDAKEALSSDTEATIPVLLPDLRTQTRITRGEFEAMIRPALEETIVSLRRAIGSAGLTPDDLSAVLLVGGSSRIPLVSQLVSDELGRPVAVDADPKTAIAMGAALAISPQPVQPAAPPPPMRQGPPPGPPRGVQHSGPSPRVGPAAGAAGAAAFAGAGMGGPGGQGAPPRPTASAVPPPRPAMARSEPPPRPDTRPAEYGQGGYGGGPDKRKQTGLWIGIGGLIAVAAILAVVFWPSSSTSGSNSTSNTGTLTPAESTPTSAPATTERKSSSSGSGTTHHTTRHSVPPSTTHNYTSTRRVPPSSEESKPTRSEEPSRSNKPNPGSDGSDNGPDSQGGSTPSNTSPDNSGSGSGNPQSSGSSSNSGSGSNSGGGANGDPNALNSGSDTSSGSNSGSNQARTVQSPPAGAGTQQQQSDKPGGGWTQPQSSASTNGGTGWAQPDSGTGQQQAS